jgi:hypothetical protein
MRTVMVRYRVRPDAAAENERLIQQVFAQLAREQLPGVRYQVVKLADGVSFVHLASHDDEGVNPLTELVAFKDFVRGIRERCVEPPATVEAQWVGAYASVLPPSPS